MKKLIIALLLTACGTDENGSPSIAQATEKDERTEAKDDDSALMVKDEASKPQCKVAGQLIYVIDIKQFQSCNGSDWVQVDVENKTTTNNTVTNNYAAQNVYVDPNGGEWIFYRTVQKSSLFNGKICPSGFAVATRAQLLYIGTQTDMISTQVILASVGINIWVAEGGIAQYTTASSSSVVAQEGSYSVPGSAATTSFPNAKGAVCVK